MERIFKHVVLGTLVGFTEAQSLHEWVFMEDLTLN